MEQYKKLCRDTLENGKYKSDRTNTGTISLFGHQSRYNLNDGFPLLTTKKVFFKGILVELLWIISGSTNIQPLVKQNVHIWDEWPFETYKKSDEYQGETIKEFASKVGSDLYIIPSSVHEVLLLPNNIEYDKDYLTDLVKEVNSGELSTEDILSDHVYYYSRKDDAITY